MYTEYEKQIALDIIETMIKENNLEEVVESGSFSKFTCPGEDSDREVWCDWLHNSKYEDITCASGCTKLVIICSELDEWVIKTTYGHARRHLDYCKMEAGYFEHAVEEGCSEYFAETYYLTTINGYNYYLQEKLATDSVEKDDAIFEYTSNNYVDRSRFDSDDDFNDEVWNCSEELDYDDLIDALMPDGYEKVTAFVDSYDINDLHQANYGMTINGRFKIIDYSGYYE